MAIVIFARQSMFFFLVSFSIGVIESVIRDRSP
jgi:hypothetical protein